MVVYFLSLAVPTRLQYIFGAGCWLGRFAPLPCLVVSWRPHAPPLFDFCVCSKGALRILPFQVQRYRCEDRVIPGVFGDVRH